MTTPAAPNHDPMPEPPEAPDINACCGSGCDPCIFDSHDMAMDEYRQALRAWRARQEAAQGQAQGGNPTPTTEPPQLAG